MDQISSIVHRHSIRSPLLCLGRLNTSSILRTLAFIATRSTLLLASVCQSRPVAMNSPWPRAFSPRTPPVVGWNNPVEHHCSLASSMSGRRRRPEGLASVRRSNWTCGFPASSFHRGASFTQAKRRYQCNKVDKSQLSVKLGRR